MAKGTPVSDSERKAIIEAIKAGKSSVAIAREFDRGTTTISNVAKKAGLSHLFEGNPGLEKAFAASVNNMAHSRARLAERFLEEAHAMLDKLHQPHIAYSFGGKDNTYNEHEFDEPPTSDKKNLMTTAAIAADKHLKLVDHDQSKGAESVGSLLGTMIDEMVEKHGVHPDTQQDVEAE